MAYTFAPRGLQLTSSFSNATPSGQIDNYLIPSGYATNIASGDLVAVNLATGTIRSVNDVANYTTTPNVGFGVFVSCSFGLGYGQSQVFPASTAMTPIPNTGTPYWPGGTITKDGMPALAQVIVDPNMVYNIQASGDQTLLNADRPALPGPVVAPAAVLVAGMFIPFNTYGVRFSNIQGQANVGSTFQGLSTMSAIAPFDAGALTGVNLYMLRYSPSKELNTGEWVLSNGVMRPTDPYPVVEVKLNASQMQVHALRDTNADIAKEVAEIKKALNLMMKDQLKKEGR
jgi:hypothetical protein